MALIAPSHLIRKIEGHKNKVTKCNKNQSKGEYRTSVSLYYNVYLLKNKHKNKA
jgi:hypothetical protein